MQASKQFDKYTIRQIEDCTVDKTASLQGDK